MNNWFDHISYHVRTHPQKPAMVMEDRVVTYEMMYVGIERCARRLVALDLAGKGQIAVLVRNPIRHLTLCFALFRIGVQSVSLEHGQAGIKMLKFPAVLGDRDAAGVIDPSIPLVEVTDGWFATDVAGAVRLPDSFRNGSDIYRASFSSGSTGVPKLIPRRIDGIGRRVFKFNDTNWSVILDLPGLSTNWGFMTAFAVLATGRTVCFAESPFQAIRMIELFSVDFVMASTEQVLALTRVARKTGAQVSSLRTVWFGGSVPTRILLESAVTYLCKGIVCGYGASEIGLMAQVTAQEVLSKPGLVGHVLPGVAVAIFDRQGKLCPPGQVGMIHARLQEGSPPDMDQAGWIDLGDVGWIAPDGALYVVGRVSEANAIASQVSPVHEVEQVLRLEWDVTDVAAVQIDERTHGLEPQIWVGIVDNKDASAEKIAAIVRRQGIEQPIKLFHLQAIPRGANGKVNREQLKALMLATPASVDRS